MAAYNIIKYFGYEICTCLLLEQQKISYLKISLQDNRYSTQEDLKLMEEYNTYSTEVRSTGLNRKDKIIEY